MNGKEKGRKMVCVCVLLQLDASQLSFFRSRITILHVCIHGLAFNKRSMGMST